MVSVVCGCVYCGLDFACGADVAAGCLVLLVACSFSL